MVRRLAGWLRQSEPVDDFGGTGTLGFNTMKYTNKCPKCGSKSIVADAKALDRGHYNSEGDLSIVTYRTPEALLFKGKQTTPLSAWVCADCGYVEFYADIVPKLDPPTA